MSAGPEPSDVPRVLPRGPHGLDPAVVAESQRVRILNAIAEVVSEIGYGRARVADVIDRAGVSRRTFYELFKNKEECFLAAFDQIDTALEQAILNSIEPTQTGEERLRAAYDALCRTLAARPAFARAFAVVAPEAGAAAQARRDRWREESIARLRLLYASAPDRPAGTPAELSEEAGRAIIGAVDALLTHQIQLGATETLPDMVPTIVDIALALMTAGISGPAT